ncbi:hypothetical protein NL676_012156 [Syzygium grande]|nr:hypothetical protein NL676_012156 [Syzygium grande]
MRWRGSESVGAGRAAAGGVTVTARTRGQQTLLGSGTARWAVTGGTGLWRFSAKDSVDLFVDVGLTVEQRTQLAAELVDLNDYCRSRQLWGFTVAARWSPTEGGVVTRAGQQPLRLGFVGWLMAATSVFSLEGRRGYGD